jgi:light-regulated signal transduction histidine kinase (bacteriophytochrome)
MPSSSTPASDPLAEALRENQDLRNSLAQIQAELHAIQENSKQLTAVADSANEQLQQFFYAASHDLQEPLRGVITYAQLLERQFAADPANHEYTTFILNGALRMRELLQQLLAYSRAGAAKQRTLINLNVPLQMALLKLDPQIASCGAQIVHNPLPEAIADETEISQVFQHIISNSLKYHSDAPPEIAITAEEGTEECTVTVKDNGMGIDPRFCEQILLPFKRLHASDLSGNGLGLAICDKIIRAPHGRIRVESDGTHGATVRFTLPV